MDADVLFTSNDYFVTASDTDLYSSGWLFDIPAVACCLVASSTTAAVALVDALLLTEAYP
jgi:hypothetical protein